MVQPAWPSPVRGPSPDPGRPSSNASSGSAPISTRASQRLHPRTQQQPPSRSCYPCARVHLTPAFLNGVGLKQGAAALLVIDPARGDVVVYAATEVAAVLEAQTTSRRWRRDRAR